MIFARHQYGAKMKMKTAFRHQYGLQYFVWLSLLGLFMDIVPSV